ncbi:hypothetical protein [Nocardioides litoris]|uniref:hypothetical protein n=1 Tax=Nocardioides litoris TaxID=1926648 RepID=UPI0011242398|nr:hypothetical protein [Nocardioides litoris]
MVRPGTTRAAALVGAALLGLPSWAVAAVAASTGPTATPVDLGGTPRAGSSDPGTPTEVTAGLWSDSLEGPGGDPSNARWFSYRRTMAGSAVLVAVTATSPESSDSIGVAVRAGTTECGSDTSTAGYPVAFSAFGASVVAPDGTFGERDDPCLTAETLAIRVDRAASSAQGEVPFALRVVEEAPVRSAEPDLPTPPTETIAPTPDVGDGEEVAGAGSFDGAPDLAPGSYADALPEGTERLYRVRLDWGQSLAVRAELPAADEATVESFGGAGPTVSLTLFDPLRNSFDGGAEGEEAQVTWGADAISLYDGTVPVAYLARFEGSPVTVPGDYWFSLAVAAAPEDRDALEVPVEIGVEVEGDPEGAPSFATTVQAPDSGPGPDDYDPATPYLLGDGQWSAEVAGVPRGPGEGGAGSSARRAAGGALALVSLLCLGAGGVLLRRRVSPAAAR